MAKFTVVARNMKNNMCVVVTTFEASTAKEARIRAISNYMQYLTEEEQMVVANDKQYEKFWRNAVEATDAIANN